MTELVDITSDLEKPFSIEDIELLPKGKTERDGKTLCMALPYADPRVYQDRLNKLVPGEWSTPAPLALTVGNKLVCYVTVVVCGISHTDVGEADPGENQGTEAFAQAFKRAASQFGLGRYLYDLEKEWVLFNPQRKQIELNVTEKRAIIRKMYQKAGFPIPGSDTPVTRSQPPQAEQDVKKSKHTQNQETAQETHPSEAKAQPKPSCFAEIEKLLDEYQKLFPDWCEKTPHWKSGVTRKALDIPKEQALPKGENYTEDDVHRFSLFLVSKQQEANHAKGTAA